MKVKSVFFALLASSMLSCFAQSAFAAPAALDAQPFQMTSEVTQRAAANDQKLAFGYWICWPGMAEEDCYWLPGD